MRLPALGVIVLAALAGCGGSDSSDDEPRRPAPAPATSKDTSAFVRRVDAACKSAYPELAEIMTSLTQARDAARAGRASPNETFETFARLLRRASATTERLRSRLRAIEAPRGEMAFHEALIDSLEQGSSNLRRQVSAAEAQDARRLSALSTEGSILNARAKGLVTGHGDFRFCGRR